MVYFYIIILCYTVPGRRAGYAGPQVGVETVQLGQLIVGLLQLLPGLVNLQKKNICWSVYVPLVLVYGTRAGYTVDRTPLC